MDDERKPGVLQLYVVRHAAAEDASAGMPDADRALTEKGRDRFRKTARKLGGKVPAIELILTSPLVRAVQTAEILAGEVRHDAVRVLPELAGGVPAEGVLQAVSAAAGKHRSVALVGHNPQLTEVIAKAVGSKTPDEIELRKGVVVLLEVKGAPGSPDAQAQARWWMRSGDVHSGLPQAEDED